MTDVPETLPAAIERFETLLETAPARLRALSEAQAGTPRAPGTWTPVQILGHLCDSAANNHPRFVRGQLEPQPPFWGYAQDAWVEVERWDTRGWPEVVTLWEAYNRHLLHLMRHAQPDALERVFVGTGYTLGLILRDYVRHCEHHLEQIWASETPA